MYGRFSFKAIFVGLLVKVFAGAILGGIAGVAAMALLTSAARGGSGFASSNAAQFTQTMTGVFSSPLFIIGTVAAAVLSALLSGYVTASLAPGAEMRNIGFVMAIFVSWELVNAYSTFIAMNNPATAGPFGASVMTSLLWTSLAWVALSIPAFFGGGALRMMKNAPASYSDAEPFR